MARTQSTATITRHLRALLMLMEGEDFSSHAEDRALRAAIELLVKPDDFNARLRSLLETKFDWLNSDEPADGSETVDAVREIYAEAGGTVCDGEFGCPCAVHAAARAEASI